MERWRGRGKVDVGRVRETELIKTEGKILSIQKVNPIQTKF